MKKKHTVLVVDDEPDVVRSVKDLLRLEYRVIGATSAKEGEEILAREEVHAVMTDQRMPGMTGVEFLKQVRGDHPDAVRLLFTGYADIHAVIDAINQGNVYRYITKPWDPDELHSVIREACERYDLLVERKRMMAELEQKNRALEQSGALKSAFIQVASHELRTPLSILLGLTNLARRMPGTSPPMRDLLERIDQSSHRMSRLVDQIITMLSAEQFDRVIERQRVELADVIREAIEDVRPFIELRHQTLEQDLPDSLGAMELDRLKIRDCLNHLLLNAIKFTPDGGRITVSAARLDDGSARIVVSDTGCGIDEVCRPHLFDPFFTGFDVSHHSSGQYEHGRKGLGLGLSVVKSFIELHGGKIDVDSEPGRGSTFTLTLPQTSAAPSPVPSNAHAG